MPDSKPRPRRSAQCEAGPTSDAKYVLQYPIILIHSNVPIQLLENFILHSLEPYISG